MPEEFLLAAHLFKEAIRQYFNPGLAFSVFVSLSVSTFHIGINYHWDTVVLIFILLSLKYYFFMILFRFGIAFLSGINLCFSNTLS